MPHLSPDLAALSRPAPGALEPVTVRLSKADLAQLDRLRQQLNGPSRGALLRLLVTRGLQTVSAELEAA